jgi:hypothetical protein
MTRTSPVSRLAVADSAPRSRLDRWRALPATERRLALGLACLLPLVDVSLRLFGFQRTWRWLARWAPLAGGTHDSEQLDQAQRLAALARSVGAGSPWATSCLRQALSVWLLLRRRGLDPELKIGVVRREPPFQAHAWVELDGIALDPQAQGQATFPSLRPSGRA